ncbi:ClpXP protease specificity-enhancing factor [Herbaspirillum sp. RTI4]|uniref:ClpXP protease specificity-enhancing factor n=1 Tax=Herbaspirillum sp. RTI4 TaxID=3048640 RepID=UPI002AB4CC9C|nr:ClpXP protease specificity-enhancing factor [Herbaspirillum sp. RTI4]MDY7577768.1 ClpXP protease specificity-enhancing factor [Herbaspirillum sp. RTI4]MEA9980804.1 ClpXP protease specificity-enhancing factor [Herbaspirillum sp. RTI4]
MSEVSTKPYLLRAIYEWCTDNGYTPHIAVMVNGATQVPMQFVKNGEIVLNISFDATSGLKIDNDLIRFSARFSGVSRDISVPVHNVLAIYASENGQGMAFEAPSAITPDAAPGLPPSALVPEVATSTFPTLTSVPSLSPTVSGDGAGRDPENPPEPPKKGGRPTLTRVK